MPTGSRGLSFFLAIAIAAVVTAFLYLIPSTSSTVLWAALLLSFSISYLLISITLEFLVFREIGNIYTLLEKIQKKDLTEIKNKSLGSSLSPLKKINAVINSYALARQREIEALQKNYANAGVKAELTPFIENTAQAFADADLIICRAGASTVTEISAVGAAAIYVPFPFAVDDHQTTNANFLVSQDAGWLMPQSQLTPELLAERLKQMTRTELLARAEKAWALKKIHATQEVVAACEALAA